MKIRAGCIIDYEVDGFKEAGEIEALIQTQVELIVARDPRVSHYSTGAKQRRSTNGNTKVNFNDITWRAS